MSGELPMRFIIDPSTQSEADRIFTTWNDLFLAIIARSKLGGFSPGDRYFQGVVEDSISLGIRISPSYVLSDGLPRLVVVNLYTARSASEEHLQTFLADSAWKERVPSVRRVEELPFTGNNDLRLDPERAGRLALQVALNLEPAKSIPVFQSSRLQ